MGNGNGNGYKSIGWRAKTAGKSAQLLVADVAGNAAELAFLRYEHALNQTFPFLREAFKTAMYYPVKLVQRPVEQILEHAGNFEDKEFHDQRVKQTQEQRLDGLLNAAYDYTAAGAVGLGALICAERGLSKVMKTEHFPGWSWGVDAMVHTGIVVYMSSSRMKPTTEKIKNTIESAMKTAGWDKDDAKRDATFATVYIVPNYMNWVSNSLMAGGMYYGEHNKMWKPQEGLFKNLRELGEKLGVGGGKQVSA